MLYLHSDRQKGEKKILAILHVPLDRFEQQNAVLVCVLRERC